jgi:anti-anti-sigma regulatory factor
VIVQPVADQAVVLRLAGTIDADDVGLVRCELDLSLRRADERGLRLVLEVSGVPEMSGDAVDALAVLTQHRAAVPVLVAGATPEVAGMLTATPLPGIRLYPALESAVAAACAGGHPSGASARHVEDEIPGEVFGLRAKARTSGIIGIAQGMLIARYGLPGPAAAFALLRAGSQHHNVPLRVLASAVVTAPAPGEAEWFPGRRHTAPPAVELLTAGMLDPRDRRQVLKAAVYAAVTLTEADAAEIHLTDTVQDEALVLEAHHGLDAAYRDCLALVLGPPAVCARAHALGRPVTVFDVAADPELAAHPVGRAALAAGSRTLHSTPMMPDRGVPNGVISVHRRDTGAWLSTGQEAVLDGLAHDLAVWRSWYRRTVVQDALEYLHTHGRTGG